MTAKSEHEMGEERKRKQSFFALSMLFWKSKFLLLTIQNFTQKWFQLMSFQTQVSFFR